VKENEMKGNLNWTIDWHDAGWLEDYQPAENR